MKALGIVTMIIAIISIFVPVGGVYLTLVTAIMAVFAIGEGFTFSMIALGLNTASLAFFSPMLWVAASAQHGTQNQGAAIGLGIFLIIAQIVAMIALYWRNKKNKQELVPTAAVS